MTLGGTAVTETRERERDFTGRQCLFLVLTSHHAAIIRLGASHGLSHLPPKAAAA